jgi:hypothetical protein
LLLKSALWYKQKSVRQANKVDLSHAYNFSPTRSNRYNECKLIMKIDFKNIIISSHITELKGMQAYTIKFDKIFHVENEKLCLDNQQNPLLFFACSNFYIRSACAKRWVGGWEDVCVYLYIHQNIHRGNWSTFPCTCTNVNAERV